MIENIDLRVDPRTAAQPLSLAAALSDRLGLDANRIKAHRITRRSIDARQRRVMVNLSVRVWIDEEPATTSLIKAEQFPRLPEGAPEAIVVGAGPAGLFAALRLIQKGIRPILLERGKDVDSRRRDMAGIARENVVDPDSNYCFGEGGSV